MVINYQSAMRKCWRTILGLACLPFVGCMETTHEGVFGVKNETNERYREVETRIGPNFKFGQGVLGPGVIKTYMGPIPLRSDNLVVIRWTTEDGNAQSASVYVPREEFTRDRGVDIIIH